MFFFPPGRKKLLQMLMHAEQEAKMTHSSASKSLIINQTGFEMCFLLSSTFGVGCWGSQPKHVRLWYGAGGLNQNTS